MWRSKVELIWNISELVCSSLNCGPRIRAFILTKWAFWGESVGPS